MGAKEGDIKLILGGGLSVSKSRRVIPSIPVMDAHTHMFVRPDMANTAEMVIAELDRLGMDMAVVFQENSNMVYRTPDYNPYIGHDYVAAMQEKYPDRIIGFMTVNPWHQSSKIIGWKEGSCDLVPRNYTLEELDRCIKTWGMRGVKFHPGIHFYAFDDSYTETRLGADKAPQLVGTILQRISELQSEVGRKIPVLIHGASSGMVDHFNTPDQIAYMAKRFPDIPFIISHMGVPWHLVGAIRVARENRNIYLETAATSTEAIRMAVNDVGADRVIMGADSPFLSYEGMLSMVAEAVPDTSDRAMVMGGTLAKLLKII
jgi:predicted TIM-barrel fold metal-dependent hydrolase